MRSWVGRRRGAGGLGVPSRHEEVPAVEARAPILFGGAVCASAGPVRLAC